MADFQTSVKTAVYRHVADHATMPTVEQLAAALHSERREVGPSGRHLLIGRCALADRQLHRGRGGTTTLVRRRDEYWAQHHGHGRRTQIEVPHLGRPTDRM